MAALPSDDEEEEDYDFEPTLENILESKTLKWIFVGGKGGVGKTTTSCSLAVMLAQEKAKTKERVLIISTDPAHVELLMICFKTATRNIFWMKFCLSDAFGQQFGATETRVNGIDNLYAMEIDPKVDFSQMANVMNRNDASGGDGGVNSLLESANANFLSDLSSSVPGIDEAMSFAEIFKQVKKKDFSCIVFDTAPTGHTLRLLSFPTVLQKAIVKIDGLRSKFGGLFQNFANMLNQNGSMQNDNNVNAAEMIEKKLKEMKDSVDEIKKQFENCDLTTFVCVCIPEFLSLYETERLIQKLAKFGIDSHNIVINQVLYPEKGSNCKRCQARVKMQSKYISQFDDLYPDFNLVKIPLMNTEVRHLKRLKQYAHWLVNSYQDAYESNDYNDSVLDLNDANDANDKDGKDKNNNKNNSNENETKTDDDDNDNDNDNDGVDVIDVD